MTKYCPSCDLEKDYSEFYINKSKIDGLQANCKVCKNGYYQKWYSRPDVAEKVKKRTIARNARVKQEAQKWIISYLRSHPCVDCHEMDISVLEFDHLHSKILNISTLVSNIAALSTIQAEVAKCEVVCANCHRRRTYKRYPKCYKL